MTTTVVRYQVKPERADENQRLVEDVFAELAERQPARLRYATFRLHDGVTFVHVATVEPGATSNPLFSVPAFSVFQAEIADRCDVQPLALGADVVGSYRLLSD